MKSMWYYRYPIGEVGIGEEDGAVTHLIFHRRGLPDGYAEAETPLLCKAAKQITEYFAGERTVFDLPLRLHGTEFQQKVWAALCTIPYGETRSYKQIAEQTGNPRACRAVGMANNRNPVSIIVPCHRVVGHNGALTGYGGGLPAKEYLLKLEQGHG